jgi:hypothetical protein
MEDVTLYSDKEYLVFTIEDIPHPTNPILTGCENCSSALRTIASENHSAITAVYGTLGSVHKIFSFGGLRPVPDMDIDGHLPIDRFARSYGLDPVSPLPEDVDVSRIGEEKFQNILYKPSRRETGREPEAHLMRKRVPFIPMVLAS